ncbi:MAG TPA: hypothetical protein VKH35_00995 [Thermoanaerobaculia bacterium]|nr:hypothetical protein [Thermoanaerobaculia bacterium]
MQRLRPEERREFQRLKLTPTISGTLGAHPVVMLEVGVLGARVQHQEPLDLQHAELHFSFQGSEIRLKCEIVRTSAASAPFPARGFQSGLRFLAVIGDGGDKLRDMLAQLVTRELEVRRTTPSKTEIPKPTVDGDKTVRGSDAKFLCYRFENGQWSRRAVFLPEQPSNGFTVARAPDSDEIQRLCRVFEASDDEGRRLIQLFAELSVSDELEIPPAVQP